MRKGSQEVKLSGWKEPSSSGIPSSPHLQEVEAVGAAGGEVLHGLDQVLPVLHAAAPLHLRHVHRGLLVAPVQLVDVRVVSRFQAFVRVLWPGREGGSGISAVR